MNWRNIPIDTHNCHLAITACGELAEEIADLREKLEYAYRCVNMGFVFGSFDFSVLRKEATEYLKGLDT